LSAHPLLDRRRGVNAVQLRYLGQGLRSPSIAIGSLFRRCRHQTSSIIHPANHLRIHSPASSYQVNHARALHRQLIPAVNSQESWSVRIQVREFNDDTTSTHAIALSSFGFLFSSKVIFPLLHNLPPPLQLPAATCA